MTITPQENTIQETVVDNKDVTISNQEKVDANSSQVAPEIKATEKADDPNWKAFREARKKDRAEKEAAERRAAEKEAEAAALKAAMEAAFAKSNNAPQQQYGYQQSYDQPEETEEQRIERKVQEAIAKREEKARKEAAEREVQELPHRLHQQFPDYSQIVTQENIDYIEYHHPELAASLGMHPNNFAKWSLLYNSIKKYIPNAKTARKESAKADNNFMKPRSMSNTGLTQNTEASSGARLSEEKKAANWARMQESLKSL